MGQNLYRLHAQDSKARPCKIKPHVVLVVSGSSDTDCRPLFEGKETGPNNCEPSVTKPTLEKAHSSRGLRAVRLCSIELPRYTHATTKNVLYTMSGFSNCRPRSVVLDSMDSGSGEYFTVPTVQQGLSRLKVSQVPHRLLVKMQSRPQSWSTM